MIQICGKPILEYIISELTKLGFDELCIVIGENSYSISEYFGNGKNFGAKIQYMIQKNPHGTANALLYAAEFVKNDPFLVYLSDTIILPSLKKYLQNMVDDKSEISILSSKILESDFMQVGNIEVDSDMVTNFNEKSSLSKSNLGWAGLAFFKNNFIFQLIKELKPSFRGEYEIPDAINKSIKIKKFVRNHLCEKFIDSGTKAGLLQFTQHILKEHKPKSKTQVNSVHITETVYLGKDCLVGKDVKLGPFVSIGDSVEIQENTSINNSLIFDKQKIKANQIISNSILFNNEILKNE